MKIEYVSDDEFIIYLNKLYYTFDKSTIENVLTKILKRIKKMYNVELFSTFNVECYINNNYGVILKINREYDPFNLYSKKTNLNVKFYENVLFLYGIDNYFIKDNCNKYIYKNKVYIDTSDIDDILEHINSIIYGDMALRILNSWFFSLNHYNT